MISANLFAKWYIAEVKISGIKIIGNLIGIKSKMDTALQNLLNLLNFLNFKL